MLIGELINNLAQKAGVPADSLELKEVLGNAALADIKVPDTLSSTMEGGLLSIDAAKNNHPDIKKVYTAAVYDGMDRKLIEILGSDTFEPADLEEIKAQGNTTKRYELTIAKLKAAKASAKGADKEEINRQLQAAHDAAKAAKDEVESLKATHQSEIQGIKKAAILTAKFSNYKTIYDDLDPSIKSASVEAIINKALQDKNAVLNVDDNGNLTLVSKDGSNVFGSNHVQLTPQSFLDQTLAPILKVSGPPKPVSTQRLTPDVPLKVNEGAEATVSSIKNHNESVIAAMSAAPVSLV